jgi:transposase
MSQKTKRVFDKDFKENIVKMVLNKEKKISELSREFDINANIIHTWKNQYLSNKDFAFPGKGHQSPEDAELRKLRQKLKEVSEERDILKKALGIFSKP